MDRRAHPAHSFTYVILSDTNEVKLIDNSGINTSEQALDYPRAFHANADGVLVFEGAGNISGHTVTINVINGVTYHYSAKKFLETGSCMGAGNTYLVAMR